MSKTRASLWMLGVTAAAVIALLVSAGVQNQPGQAAEVTVCRVEVGQVEKLLAVSGHLRCTQEWAAISPSTGWVAQVCVRPGDAVQAGQALFRLGNEAQAAAVSAALAGRSTVDEALPVELPAVQLQQAAAGLEQLTVRAAAEGVVQQVNVTENGGVMAGTAAVALTGGEQEIRCSVVVRDAEKLRCGLQARLMKDDELLAMAWVREIGPAQVSQTTGQTVCQVCLAPMEKISLPLGAAVDAEIILQQQSGVPTLPVEAVTGAGTVWWIADGRCYETPAAVLLADEERCWVDLPVDMQVVLRGSVSEGKHVREAAQ